MLALDSDIRFEEAGTIEDEKKTGGNMFNPLGILANTAKKVVVDTVLKTGVDTIKSGVNSVGSVIMSQVNKPDEEYLKAKKYKDTFDVIEPSVLKSRIQMGK